MCRGRGVLWFSLAHLLSLSFSVSPYLRRFRRLDLFAARSVANLFRSRRVSRVCCCCCCSSQTAGGATPCPQPHPVSFCFLKSSTETKWERRRRPRQPFRSICLIRRRAHQQVGEPNLIWSLNWIQQGLIPAASSKGTTRPPQPPADGNMHRLIYNVALRLILLRRASI